MPSPRLAVLLVPALALAGCTVGDDGPTTTQTRDVAAFARIDNPTSVDVRVAVGERQRVRVRAGEKVIGDVRTEVSGSGDAEVSAGERLDVAVDGSGDVRYHGDPAVTQHVDGSGDLSRAG